MRQPRDIQVIPVPVEEQILRMGSHHGATYFEHVAFLDALRNGTPPEVSARDGWLAVAMGVAAQRSIEERRPVEMSEVLMQGGATR